jgi:hypothetical protein
MLIIRLIRLSNYNLEINFHLFLSLRRLWQQRAKRSRDDDSPEEEKFTEERSTEAEERAADEESRPVPVTSIEPSPPVGIPEEVGLTPTGRGSIKE